ASRPLQSRDRLRQRPAGPLASPRRVPGGCAPPVGSEGSHQPWSVVPPVWLREPAGAAGPSGPGGLWPPEAPSSAAAYFGRSAVQGPTLRLAHGSAPGPEPPVLGVPPPELLAPRDIRVAPRPAMAATVPASV